MSGRGEAPLKSSLLYVAFILEALLENQHGYMPQFLYPAREEYSQDSKMELKSKLVTSGSHL
jgi:hypothetical protein